MGDSYNRMKMKLLQLDRDLVLSAIKDVQRVQHFKEMYQMSVTYDIGEVLFKIRSKFARMTRVYILSHDKLDLVWHHNVRDSNHSVILNHVQFH